MSILLFVLMFQLTSCKEDSKSRNKDIKTKTETKAVFDTIFDRKNPYYAFIKKNHPKALNDEVSFFKEADLDLDGQDEVILAFSKDSDAGPFLENFFVLKNENGIIKEIKNDFDFGNYSYKDIQLISLRGKSKSYIKVETFEGPYAFGFAIYEMINNQIKQVFISPSVGKNYREYDDSLVDSKKDGQFDTYIQNILHQNLTVENTFSFENGISKLKKTDYIFEGYPGDIEALINHYMCIRSINSSNNKLNQRLQLLCNYKNANELLSRETWGLIYNYSIENIEPIKINMNEEELTAEAVLDFKDSKKNIDYQLKFDLQKNGEKWQITNIEVIK